jgi:hypothetical protein
MPSSLTSSFIVGKRAFYFWVIHMGQMKVVLSNPSIPGERRGK